MAKAFQICSLAIAALLAMGVVATAAEGPASFSGGAIGPVGTTWNVGGHFDGTPVFLGCSDEDAHVPEARVRETADVFTRMGADVTLRIYPGMGHRVNDDEIGFAQQILDRASG